MYDTLDRLASKKKLLQECIKDGEDADLDGLIDEEEAEFLPLDDISEGKNIDLNDEDAPVVPVAVPRMPLVLVPLADDEKANDSALIK